MLNLKTIIENFDETKKKLQQRNFDVSLLDKLQKLSVQRSNLMSSLQVLEAKRNQISKEVGILKSKGQSTDELFEEVSQIKKQIDSIAIDEANVSKLVDDLLLIIPNIPNGNVPVGKDDSENQVIAEHDKLGRGLITDVKPHYEIGLQLGIVDFERAVKMSGTRFWIYKGQGAKLVRSLEQFMLETHIKKGYQELRPPIIVNANIMQGTGQLPKFKDDLFKIEGLNSYLIPTSEVPLTNYYANEIIDLTHPKCFTAATPCFRAEAGSGGKDMKGLIRAHQFNKVEIVKITSQEDLTREYKATLEDAKNILELLQLPYRELQLCTGDLGFSSEETIDLEVWIPSENKYREISSVSRFNDFQGRRCGIRYKNKLGKNISACTINGSGLAIDRTVAAILENCQYGDTIMLPDVLVPYFGKTIIEKEK